MHVRWAAVAAVALIATCNSARSQSAEILSLDGAMKRVAAIHPELRLYEGRQQLLSTELDRASQRPGLTVGAELENVLGTGDFSGVDAAELTLTLASVLERGGKLNARRVLAQTQIDALAVDREVRRLDLMAEVARRYVAVVGSARELEVAKVDREQRERAVDAARQRVRAGASPESVLLTAQASLARAELQRDRSAQRIEGSRRHLAALWNERNPSFEVASGDPLALPEIASLEELSSWLERTPEITQFASESRIRAARVQLAHAQGTPDLQWQVGIRQLAATDDFALVGGVTLPLGTKNRARPDLMSANAELGLLATEREAQEVSLYSALVDAHGRYQLAALEVQRLRNAVIPTLTRAEAAAERAYRAGAVSYLEWAQVQSERTSARLQQLNAAIEAQLVLIEIQRLTGQPFVGSSGVTGEAE